MPIRDALQAELAVAMQRRDRAVTSALRSALSALANAQAVPAPSLSDLGSGGHIAGATPGLAATEAVRRDIGVEEQRAIVDHERADLLAHGERLRRLCRHDEADGALRAAEALAAALARR